MLDSECITAISSALRHQSAISDRSFDRLFPGEQRFRSHLHWTPVDVALRACALLGPEPHVRVLDVGSGVGKLCLVGATSTMASWVGIESNAEMVRAANDAAHRLQVADRALFIRGDVNAYDWSHFDSIYMFNPFAEMLFGTDVDAVARRQQFLHNVERAQVQLARLRPGTRLVTYHGFGGAMPAGFDLVYREPAQEDRLCLWVRHGRPTLSSDTNMDTLVSTEPRRR